MPSKRRSEQREAVAIDWTPTGNGGKARLVAVGADTGSICDIDTIDLSRASDRRAYAARAAEQFGQWTVAEVEAELLRLAAERCRVVPEPEAPLPTLVDALVGWRQQERVPCVTTGLQCFDGLAGGDLPGGLPLGQLAILLGRPGSGKSALALQLALGALLADSEVRVAWAKAEMSLDALATRMIAAGSVLIGSGSPVTMSAASRRKAEAMAVAEELQSRIGDRLVILPPPITVDRMAAAVAATGAKLLCVDYLQLCQAPGSADDRQRFDAVLGGLREVSLTHGCSIILVSSIARAVDSTSKIGSLVKGTNAGDYDADIALVADADADTDENGMRPTIWRCAKNRHGAIRDLRLLFDPRLQVFTDADAAAPFDEFLDHSPRRPR